jgi:xanthoxin dehydrogenase
VRLEGKVALITGAASGLGQATVERFIQEGAKVTICDIQDEVGQALSDRFAAETIFCSCDVTKENDVEAAVDATISRFGQLDAVFHSAGIIGAVGPISTTPADEWRYSIDVLLHGTFYTIKHAARVMIPRGKGSIISMSSTAGVMGGWGPHAYAAAKHAVVGLTKNVAAELCGKGVRVNAIAAAAMATPMVAASFFGDPSKVDESIEQLIEMSPLKDRPGLALDVANAALWLASDESGYTTGHNLTTDAGVTIGATPSPPHFAEYEPLFREAGLRGLD